MSLVVRPPSKIEIGLLSGHPAAHGGRAGKKQLEPERSNSTWFAILGPKVHTERPEAGWMTDEFVVDLLRFCILIWAQKGRFAVKKRMFE